VEYKVRSKKLLTVTLLSLFFYAFPVAVIAAPLITPLIKIGDTTIVHNKICQHLNVFCNDDNGYTVYKLKGSDSDFYLINKSHNLIEVNVVDENYKKVNQWNFGDYHHSNESIDNSDDILSRVGYEIYPAIYPIGKNDKAIALVYKWFTGYAGGGRENDYADFLTIEKNGKFNVAFQNILFYQSEIMRACFTDSDYKKHSHCQDESWSILNIHIIDDGEQYYKWKLLTKSYDWPSFEDKEKTKVEINSETVIPFQQK
jgi:hypothetical protein